MWHSDEPVLPDLQQTVTDSSDKENPIVMPTQDEPEPPAVTSGVEEKTPFQETVDVSEGELQIADKGENVSEIQAEVKGEIDDLMPTEGAELTDDGVGKLVVVQTAPMTTPLTKAGMPYNSVKTLRELGFSTIGEVLGATEADLSKIKNLTVKKRKRILQLQDELRKVFYSAGEPLTSDLSIPADVAEGHSELPASVEIEGEQVDPVILDTERGDSPEKIDVEVREITSPRLAPLDTLLEKGGVPHRAAMTLRKFGVRTLGEYLNLTEDTISQFVGVPAQRREKILQLYSELKERYANQGVSTISEVSEEQPSTEKAEDGVTMGLERDPVEEEKESADQALFNYLTEHSVPNGDISRILFIVRNSSNGRIIYNELRKVFGNNTVYAYMKILREYRTAFE